MSNSKISPSEPVTQLRHIKIVECGEELADFVQLCPDLVFDRARFNYRRATVVRRTVAEMLCKASRSLPPDVRLGVIEGWRAPHIQRRMYLSVWQRFKEMHPDWSDAALRRVVNRFTAPLNPRVPPPHSTGGAVDVMLLAPDGTMLDHTSPYDLYDPHSAPFAALRLSDTARRTRDTLAAALLDAGLTNYPSEFWHWSYGDQGWAYRNSKPNAIYGAIQPPGYCPDPAEDIDAPLEFIDTS